MSTDAIPHFREESRPIRRSRLLRILVGVVNRMLALLFVVVFAVVQYYWWLDGRRYRRFWNPTPVLGPLYFLANESREDDCLGIVLIAMLAPCILIFPVLPTRRTAAVAMVAILVWIIPGLIMILGKLP